MKRIIVIGILGMLLLASFSVFSATGTENQIQLSYSFSRPTTTNVQISTKTYTRIIMDDTYPSCEQAGAPCLPEKGANLLIPQGHSVRDIIVSPGQRVSLGSGFKVEPVEEPVPFSDSNSNSVPTPDKSIYQSDEMYPGKFYTNVGLYSLRGYQILVLELYPVQYIPATGELFYYPNLAVSVNTVQDNNLCPLFRGTDADESQVIDMVDNPSYVLSYVNSTYQPTDNYDLLIITTDELKDAFIPLKNYHDDHGVSTIIKTLSDIGSNPNPTEIRNFIRDAYENWGITYVLIGGDNNIIPAQTLYFGSWFEGVHWVDYYGPSDLYYSCLQGTFNYDGDNKWGEKHDGDGGGDVDLFAEVYVGRACVDTISDVENFTSKTISYMGTDESDEYLTDATMAGQRLLLWNYWPSTWGSAFLEQLINGCTLGKDTIGIPSDIYSIDRLYDEDWGSNGWPKSEIINRINQGIHFLNHVGHGNFDSIMGMSASDVYSLTNDKYCFIYSQACNVGGFDNPEGYDCIGENLTVKTAHGAFACVLNARLGFELRWTTYGPSQRYQRAFWHAVFGEGITSIGAANQFSKEFNIESINGFQMRYCYYQLNLLGDPTVDLLTHYGDNQNNEQSQGGQQSQPGSQQSGQQGSNN